MSRAPRDREADRATIRAAADRLLAGTPLHSASGKLTGTELITESGLRRDVVYGHRDLVDDFQARVKAQHTIPLAMQKLTAENTQLNEQLTHARAKLATERATGQALRRAIAELSLELQQAHEELAAASEVTALPIQGSR
ncbi:hypothetical protein [Actinoallomurus sp. NPDC050550]|uniref:hypothetical protein n=1 Tax=Actinoallomurus sp. NPDC050550 TaxID=3154937 RepID=UPI0033C582EA